MTVNAVIESLYNSNDLNDCISKMVSENHQQDFKQELFLIICQQPHELLLSLYNKPGLTLFMFRIFWNLVKQKRNVYHKIYNDYKVIYDSEGIDRLSAEDECFTERILDEERELQLLSQIDSMDEKLKSPYYRLLVHAISQHKSQRALSRLTRIPVSSISSSVKRVREHLIKVCT